VLIKERMEVVQAAFYEIGQALLRLSQPHGDPVRWGYASFKSFSARSSA
jgi:hypothetical protein